MGLILDARSPSLFLKVVAYGKAGTRYQWIGHYTLTLSSLKEWPDLCIVSQKLCRRSRPGYFGEAL